MIKFFRQIRQNLLTEGKTGRYFKYAIGEIVLVVIGILIALQVNNWNEERLEKRQIEKYARSLIHDLENDLDMLEVSRYQAANVHRKIDSLRQYMAQTDPKGLSNTTLFVLSRDLLYRPYKWNRLTLDALKNSGGMSLINNDSIANRIVAYESFSQHLDEDYNGDDVNFEKANDHIVRVLVLNSDHFKKIAEWEQENFNYPFGDIFETKIFQESQANEMPLNTYERKDLNEFLNRLIIIQNNYLIRAFGEMPEIMDDAEELIQMLREEYGGAQ